MLHVLWVSECSYRCLCQEYLTGVLAVYRTGTCVIKCVLLVCVCHFTGGACFQETGFGFCLQTRFSSQQACSMANTRQKNAAKLNAEEDHIPSTTVHSMKYSMNKNSFIKIK